MSAEYPHDFHPLAPVIRQLRGALRWYQSTYAPLASDGFAEVIKRLSDLPQVRINEQERALKIAAHWASIPTVSSSQLTAPSEPLSTDALLVSPQEPPSAQEGPLEVSQFPAVIHERSVITSISFEQPPPVDHQVEGSALLMKPSLNLKLHRGEVAPLRVAELSSSEPLESSVLSTSALNEAPPVTSWGQTRSETSLGQSPEGSMLSSPPHDQTSSSPTTASPSAQLWANQPQRDESQEPPPASSPKLGASLARLSQSNNTSRVASSKSELSPRVVMPAAPSVVRRRGYEADEHYGQLCDQIRSCQACPRSSSPHCIGTGHYGARVMFVTAHPSEGDLTRGSLLLDPPERELFNQILRALSLSRLEVYITSLLKCGADLPKEREWSSCRGYFQSELELVRPELIVTLGYMASVILLGQHARPGIWGEFQGVSVMPTMHPSEILSGGDTVKRTAWRQLREVMRRSSSLSTATSGVQAVQTER